MDVFQRWDNQFIGFIRRNSQYLATLSRVFIASIFLLEAFSKFTDWQECKSYMAAHNVPLVSILLPIAVWIELVAGFCLLVGYKARQSAALLFTYLIPVTLFMHNFWTKTGLVKNLELFTFMQNVAILGGLLGIIVHGAGAYSIQPDFGILGALEKVRVEPPRRAPGTAD